MDNIKREKLEKRLYEEMPKLIADRELLNNIRKYYATKNISPVVPMRIINKNTPLTLLGDMDLCILVTAINKNSNEYNIKTEDYFTKEDIQLEEIYVKNELEDDNIITFYGVDKLRENQYFCTKLSFQELSYLASTGKISYNFNTQREAKVVYKGKDMIKIPTLNKKAVYEIVDKIKTGEYTPNTITFNLEHTGMENPLNYDEKNRTLSIILDENTQLSVVDGYHRTVSALKIIEEIPNFPGFYLLSILNYTEEQARKFIIQEDKKTPIDKEHLKYLNEEDLNMIIAKDIAVYGNPKTNLIYGKFAVNATELKHGKLCLYSVVANAIKFYFTTDNSNEIKKIKEALLRGFSQILTIKEKDFKHIDKSRKLEVTTFNNIFAFYTALIAKLYYLNYAEQNTIADSNKLENKITEIINNIDMSFNNSIWEDIKVCDKDNEVVIKKLNLLDYNRLSKYLDTLEIE